VAADISVWPKLQTMTEQGGLIGCVRNPDSSHFQWRGVLYCPVRRMNGELFALRGHGAGLTDAAFSPDGGRIVTASQDTTARVWEAGAANGGELFTLRGHDGVVTSAEFSSDGGQILTASEDCTLRLWPIAVGGEPHVIETPQGVGHFAAVRLRPTSAALSPDATRVAGALHDGRTCIWDADTGEEFVAVRGHKESRPSCVAFSPDGSRVVTAFSYTLPAETIAGRVASASVWDAMTGNGVGGFGHQSRTFCAAFSPDGDRIVTGHEDATAQVWEAGGRGETLLILQGHQGPVRGASFSPDGGRIVTASDDATVRVWDAGNGQERLVLTGHEGAVASAAFSPDGGRIVTASADATARVWRETLDEA
jgi:WD40 repeat protein